MLIMCDELDLKPINNKIQTRPLESYHNAFFLLHQLVHSKKIGAVHFVSPSRDSNMFFFFVFSFFENLYSSFYNFDTVHDESWINYIKYIIWSIKLIESKKEGVPLGKLSIVWSEWNIKWPSTLVLQFVMRNQIYKTTNTKLYAENVRHNWGNFNFSTS